MNKKEFSKLMEKKDMEKLFEDFDKFKLDNLEAILRQNFCRFEGSRRTLKNTNIRWLYILNGEMIRADYLYRDNRIYSRYYNRNLDYIEVFHLRGWNTVTTKSHLRLFNIYIRNKELNPHFVDKEGNYTRIFDNKSYLIQNGNLKKNMDEINELSFNSRQIDIISADVYDRNFIG